ncbi:MAG: hypothetical protein ABIR55_14945, partial [Burkholderiaceae bacterium]
LDLPKPDAGDDVDLRRRVGRFVVAEVAQADEYPPDERADRLRQRLATIPSRALAGERPPTVCRFLSL